MFIFKKNYACSRFEMFLTLPYTVQMYHRIYVDDIT
jgi:hypothetical protein